MYMGRQCEKSPIVGTGIATFRSEALKRCTKHWQHRTHMWLSLPCWVRPTDTGQGDMRDHRQGMFLLDCNDRSVKALHRSCTKWRTSMLASSERTNSRLVTIIVNLTLESLPAAWIAHKKTQWLLLGTVCITWWDQKLHWSNFLFLSSSRRRLTLCVAISCELWRIWKSVLFELPDSANHRWHLYRSFHAASDCLKSKNGPISNYIMCLYSEDILQQHSDNIDHLHILKKSRCDGKRGTADP